MCVLFYLLLLLHKLFYDKGKLFLLNLMHIWH